MPDISTYRELRTLRLYTWYDAPGRNTIMPQNYFPPSLRIIEIFGHANLNGTLPPLPPNLVKLDLRSNRLERDFTNVTWPQKLVHLNMAGNRWSGVFCFTFIIIIVDFLFLKIIF